QINSRVGRNYEVVETIRRVHRDLEGRSSYKGSAGGSCFSSGISGERPVERLPWGGGFSGDKDLQGRQAIRVYGEKRRVHCRIGSARVHVNLVRGAGCRQRDRGSKDGRVTSPPRIGHLLAGWQNGVLVDRLGRREIRPGQGRPGFDGVPEIVH